MQILSSCLHEGNHKQHQNHVKTRRWDKAPRWIQDRVSPQSLKTFLLIQRLTHGRPTRLAKRLLASRRGVSMKTIYNHICELIAAKVMRAVYAKISYCRNTPNLYILLDIDGGDLHLSMERNCTEKQVQILKPKASPREARRIENHPAAVRILYEQKAKLYRLLRKVRNGKRSEYRLRAAEARTRRAMEAEVGTEAAWNRLHGGLSWEERNPEEAAWYERELAKQRMSA